MINHPSVGLGLRGDESGGTSTCDNNIIFTGQWSHLLNFSSFTFLTHT